MHAYLLIMALALCAADRPDSPTPLGASFTGAMPVVPGGGAWGEVESAREAAPPPAACRNAAVAPVDPEKSSVYAVGSLATLASITLPPAGETVADWALRPLFVSPISTSVDADGATPPDAPRTPPRLCLSSPATPGGAVTVAACGVPGATPGTAITFDVVDAPRGGGEGPALTLRAAPRPRQALPGGPPVSGDTTAASIESGPQCLAALGSVVGLAPCGGPDTRWRTAPASAPDDDSPPSPAGRKAKGWTTHAGVMLVNPASGLCAVADGRLAACDAGGDGGRVFRLCSAPGACARFGVPPC